LCGGCGLERVITKVAGAICSGVAGCIVERQKIVCLFDQRAEKCVC